MTRYEESRLNEKNLLPHAALYGPHSERHAVESREWGDRSRLEKLHVLGRSLEMWAQRFTDPALFALVAACVTRESVGRLIRGISNDCEACAPAIRDKSNCRPHGHHPETVQAMETCLSAVQHLDEFINGVEQLVPSYPWTDSEGEVLWVRERTPPDHEIDVFVRQLLGRQIDSAGQQSHGSVRDAMHRRLVALAVMTVRRLKRAFELGHGEQGGLAFDSVGVAVSGRPGKSESNQFHEEMRAALAGFVELTELPDPGLSTADQWTTCADSLVACWNQWADKCLALAVAKRNTRQAKKDILRRHVACIAQYTVLMQGIEHQYRLVQTVLYLQSLGTRISGLIRKLVPPLGAAEATVRAAAERKVVELDRLVIEDRVVEQWKRDLGEDATRAGAAIGLIMAEHAGQQDPWRQKEYKAFLCRGGVLTGGGRTADKQFERLFYLMQRYGLAVQIPWERLADRQPARERSGHKLHAGETWLVNPLGHVLADGAIGSSEQQINAKQSLKKRATKKARTKRTKKKTRGA